MELIKAFRHHLAQEELDQASLLLDQMEQLHYPESILRSIEIELDKAKASQNATSLNIPNSLEGEEFFISPANYLMHRPDLQVAGFTLDQARQHLIDHGRKELEDEASRQKPRIRRYLDLNDTPAQSNWLIICRTGPYNRSRSTTFSNQRFGVPAEDLELSRLKPTLPGSNHEVSLQEFASWAMIRHGVHHFLFVDHTDTLHDGWQQVFTEALREKPDDIVFCEEYVDYIQPQQKTAHKRNRQYKSRATPFRVLTRGYVCGIVAVPTKLLATAELRESYASTWCFQVDIAQQFANHIHTIQLPLLTRHQPSNPAILEYSTPHGRALFNPAHQEFFSIAQDNIKKSKALSPSLEVDFKQGNPGEVIPNLKAGHKHPKVSVIIPFRDQPELLKNCVDSLVSLESACHIEIILADNGSTQEDTKQIVDSYLKNPSIDAKTITINEPFNFSRINNIAAFEATGDYILLLNNDIEFKSENPISSMLGYFCFETVGAVGTRLHYKDGSIQHHGIVLTPKEPYDTYSPFKTTVASEYDYSLASFICADQWSAATAACLLIDRKTWLALGGLDEKLVVAYNDVDLCLRIQATGKDIIVDPLPNIIHYESKSRGLDLRGVKYNRLYEEAGILRSKHPALYSQPDAYWSNLLSISNPRATPAYLDSPDIVSHESPLAIIKRVRGEQQISKEIPLNVCVYVNYSPTNRLRPDIIHQLKSIANFYKIIFVTTSSTELGRDPLFQRLEEHTSEIIFRDNIGYDFGSWKAGIIDNLSLIRSANSLLLVNDSLYGPLFALDNLLDRTLRSESDFTCMTLNRVGGIHAQSYYVSYKPTIIRSAEFTAFWKSIPIYCDKYQLIKNCEMRWSHYLIGSGRSFSALYDTGSYGNQTHTHWKSLITDHGYPFVKNELLLRNPVGQDLSDIHQILSMNHSLYSEMMLYWQDTQERLAFE